MNLPLTLHQRKPLSFWEVLLGRHVVWPTWQSYRIHSLIPLAPPTSNTIIAAAVEPWIISCYLHRLIALIFFSHLLPFAIFAPLFGDLSQRSHPPLATFFLIFLILLFPFFVRSRVERGPYQT